MDVTVPPLLEIMPALSDKPVPTLISSTAPALAVVRPSKRLVFIVRSEEPTAPLAADPVAVLAAAVLAAIKTASPTVVEPRLVLAAAALVAPVPPLAKARVPANVIVPLVVMGLPDVVRPVVPPETSTLVTLPVPTLVAAIVTPPAEFVMEMLEPAVSVAAE